MHVSFVQFQLVVVSLCQQQETEMKSKIVIISVVLLGMFAASCSGVRPAIPVKARGPKAKCPTYAKRIVNTNADRRV